MNIKNHLFSSLIILLFTHQDAMSDVLHWPQLCAGGELHIKNNGDSNLSVWLQKFGKNLIRETEIAVNPKSTLLFSLEEIKPEERYSILNFNSPESISVKYKCADKFIAANTLEGGVLTFKKSDLIQNKIWIQNLYSGNNKFEIEIQDINHKKIKTENLTLTQQSTVHYLISSDIKDWAYIQVSSSHKSSVFNLSSEGADSPVQIAVQKTNTDSTAFYFLVEPRNSPRDSFIAKITDEKMAEAARYLIRNPHKEKMLFAKIQKDHQGFNRNWSKTEKNFWSWSTREVTNFAEIGSTACNGTAQQLEDRVDYWVEDPGQICFWNYRVKKELTPEQVANGL